MIAVLLDQTPDPFALTAKNQDHGTLVVDSVPSFLARAIEADDPEALGFERFEGLDHVPDPSDLDAFERASRGARRSVG